MQQRDFVITEGLEGPGRFLGCTVGVRVIDHANWYGEGEVKVYRDGDTDLPTICGTGLEDYVGTAWGMGQHHAPYGGAPPGAQRARQGAEGMGTQPDFVSFYRWHVPDPIMFERDLRVTIQQIGAMFFLPGQEAELAAYEQTNPVAGEGWRTDGPPGLLAWGICERVDDYCVHVLRVLPASRRPSRRSTSPPRSPTSRGATYEERGPDGSRWLRRAGDLTDQSTEMRAMRSAFCSSKSSKLIFLSSKRRWISSTRARSSPADSSVPGSAGASGVSSSVSPRFVALLQALLALGGLLGLLGSVALELLEARSLCGHGCSFPLTPCAVGGGGVVVSRSKSAGGG